MSDVFYPMGLISDLKVERFDRTVVDAFEDGSSAANTIWGQYQFKRRFTVKHAPLSQAEFRYLRSFFGARSGKYDTFWFRDNVHRGGNAKVRLASPLPEARGASGYYSGLELVLEEVAPIRILPDFEDVATAAGQAANGGVFPLWLDANREIEYTITGDPASGIVTISTLKNFGRNDASYPAYDLAAQHTHNGTSKFNDQLAQYQSWYHQATSGSSFRPWYKSASNINTLAGGTQPAVTLFALVKHATSTTANKVLFAFGTQSAGASHGIQLRSDNYYAPWIGGSETWGTAQYLNSAASTWRSIAVSWPAASNAASLYINGALIGTESESRSYATGPIVLGAAQDGTLKVADQSGYANALNHAMAWNAELSLAQIKALHNLFAYQYGMATV